MTDLDAFPRQLARTRRFTLGVPRNVSVAPDGRHVAFLRSAGPEDAVNALWVLDLTDGVERCVADPRDLLADGDHDLPPEEKARRERARESGAGITGYATDRDHRVAVAALAGRIVVADFDAFESSLFGDTAAVIDPRPDPTGSRVAFAKDRALWVADLDDPTSLRRLVGADETKVSWGVAEFVAAEETNRDRGYWWSPAGTELLVCRVDEKPVDQWWIGDPAAPAERSQPISYPAAGRPNAEVTVWIVRLDGTLTEVPWDHEELPYVTHACWDEHGPMITLCSRDQRHHEVHAVDATSAATTLLWSDDDAAWVELMRGVPARLGDGRLVMTSDRDGTRRLLVDGEPVTPTTLTVRSVSHVAGDEILFAAHPLDDATGLDVWAWVDGELRQRTTGPGAFEATRGGDVTIMRSVTLEGVGVTTEVVGGPTIVSHGATPLVAPNVSIRHVAERRLATALLLPHDLPDDASLPVLLDPYGGPHAQRVVQRHGAYLTSQWFADQGFAVVVVDGRGTPGRGTDWERAIHLDFAGPVLEDQLDGLNALAEIEPRLDLTRVGIRGWSFGGYLAALAVLRRPDAFHAASAGAPVTDWRLYDTFYTERYLGLPDDPADPGVYERSSLLGDAANLERPLLLVHGLADDNVVAAHTLQLSTALLAHGRPHQVLPLTGVTHMSSNEDVEANLLLLELDFLRRALGLT